MIVPNEPEIFEQLKHEIFEEFPSNCTPSFKAGLEHYVKTFFQEIITHSDIFNDIESGTFTLDLDFIKVDTRQLALEHIGNFHNFDRSEFLRGVDFAEFVTIETLIFALAMQPSTLAS